MKAEDDVFWYPFLPLISYTFSPALHLQLAIYLSCVNTNLMAITRYPRLPLRTLFSTFCSSISFANTRLHINVFSIPIYFLHHFSSSSQIPNAHTSPFHQFLHKSCGLSPMQVVSASKYLQHLKTTKNPEQVVHFFRERGFSDTHIKALVYSYPRVLTSSIPNTLLPKLKLFEDMGIVDAQLADLISNVTLLLQYNIERTLLPGITFLQEQVKSNENIVIVLKRSQWILSYLETVKAIILFLQNNRIEARILLTLLIIKPNIFRLSEAKLKEFFDTTEKLGVPRTSGTFPSALFVVSGLAKDTLQEKINYFESLGLSRKEVLRIFKKSPRTLALSKKNLKLHMNFIENTLNLEPSFIVTYPSFLSYSIEKRILPRHRVFQMLQSIEVPKIKFRFMTILSMSEKNFLNKIIYKHNESAKLYEIYKGVDAADSSANG